METAQSGKANGNAGAGPLVMLRSEEGFRVYSPGDPSRSYMVSGGPQHPTCTCPEFEHGRRDEHCAHIAAVLAAFGGQSEGDRYAAEERLAIQGESKPADSERIGPGTQMLVKRSV